MSEAHDDALQVLFAHAALGLVEPFRARGRFASKHEDPHLMQAPEPYRVREGGSLICFVQDPDGYLTTLS